MDATSSSVPFGQTKLKSEVDDVLPILISSSLKLIFNKNFKWRPGIIPVILVK